MIDYDALPNPGPLEAAEMPELELQTVLFRHNYGMRHDRRSAYWRRLHRHFARQALRELRYLTNRPTKRANQRPVTQFITRAAVAEARRVTEGAKG